MMSAEVTDSGNTNEGSSETPDLRTVALLVWHIQQEENGRKA